jgi:plasmid maintenance system killer protein
MKYWLSIDLINIRNQLKQYYGEAVAIAFEKRLAFIKNAKNEIDFYAMRSD